VAITNHERVGKGVPTARKELSKNGNPPPEFTVQPGYVCVTVGRTP